MRDMRLVFRALLVLCVALVACSNVPRLQGLQRLDAATASQFAYRMVEKPYSADINDGTRVGASDLVELRCGSQPITLSIPSVGTVLKHSAPRVSAGFLASVNRLGVACGDSQERVIRPCSGGDACLPGRSLSWSSLRTPFAAIHIRAALIPMPDPIMLPGDEVTISNDFTRLDATGSAFGPFGRDMSDTVSQSGMLSVPTPKREMAGTFEQSEEQAHALQTMLTQDALELSVHHPGQCAADQPHASTLETCLNWAANPSYRPSTSYGKYVTAACLAMGMDDSFFDASTDQEKNLNLFRIATRQLAFDLITPNGEVHIVPFREGEDVDNAVMAAFPRLTGQDLLSSSTRHERTVYLTIMPASGLCASEAGAFFYEVGQAPWPVALRQGDRIFVSWMKPIELP